MFLRDTSNIILEGREEKRREKGRKGKGTKEEKIDLEEKELGKDTRGWKDIRRKREWRGSPILLHGGSQSAAAVSSENLPEM